MIDLNVIDKFRKETNFDIGSFLTDSYSFFEDDIPELVSFFKGKRNKIDKKSLDRLNKLSEKSITITILFEKNKKKLKTYDFWELLETFEKIKTKLKGTYKLSKYLRSSITGKSETSGFSFEYIMRSQETIEDVTNEILEKNNYENNWVNEAINNDLKEEEWDIKGNTKLNLKKQILQTNLVTSMIDNTIGKKIYGKDIKKLLEFKNNDLLVLSYEETLNQTVNILSTLSKSSIKEFPWLGINFDIYKGANLSQLNLPILSKELKRNFENDDLFKDFKIRSLEIDEGDLFIEYEVGTKYDELIIKNITL